MTACAAATCNDAVGDCSEADRITPAGSSEVSVSPADVAVRRAQVVSAGGRRGAAPAATRRDARLGVRPDAGLVARLASRHPGDSGLLWPAVQQVSGALPRNDLPVVDATVGRRLVLVRSPSVAQEATTAMVPTSRGRRRQLQDHQDQHLHDDRDDHLQVDLSALPSSTAGTGTE